MHEFELIRHYFAPLTPAAADVAAGIGDDCALVRPPPGELLAVTVDTLVAGRHFPDDTPPADIGWKALAVNLSDLAAAGATPRWFTLALTLPTVDRTWLDGFAGGLQALARDSRIALVGGDTTQGPLSISITAMGTLPVGVARGRGGAQPGDWICVTGTLGDAAAGLALWRNAGRPEGMAEDDAAFLEARLRRPQPRVAAGLALLGLAHAAIDLSDGLAGDLQHILDASRVGADVDIERLPASPALGRFAAGVARWRLQVCGGDDYELCLCLPPAAFEAACRALAPLPLTRIGEITALPGLRWRDGAGHEQPLPDSAYRHFA